MHKKILKIFQTYNISITPEGKVQVRSLKSKNVDFEQSFHYYEGFEGDDEGGDNQRSDAYTFRPKPNRIIDLNSVSSFRVIKGDLILFMLSILSDIEICFRKIN